MIVHNHCIRHRADRAILIGSIEIIEHSETCFQMTASGISYDRNTVRIDTELSCIFPDVADCGFAVGYAVSYGIETFDPLFLDYAVTYSLALWDFLQGLLIYALLRQCKVEKKADDRYGSIYLTRIINKKGQLTANCCCRDR